MRHASLTAALAVSVFALLAAGCRTDGTGAAGTSDSHIAEGEGDCSGAEPVGDPIEWVKSINDQQELLRVFACAKAPATQPLGHGKGLGSLFAGFTAWNDLQASVGSHIWGGKRLYREGDGVHLTNLMLDSGTERYNAQVVFANSILDGNRTIVLDYRIDRSVETYGPPATPAQAAIDLIALGIRDEIRELQVGGVGTGVYIGRANLLQRFVDGTDLKTPISDEEFADPSVWVFAANFFLDFRPGQTTPAPAETGASVTINASFNAPPAAVYNAITSFDILPEIFHDTGFLPGVARSEVVGVAWGNVGAKRTVIFNDDSHLLEEVTVLRPSSFYEYRISEFTNILKVLAASGRGQWWFEPAGARTEVKWTYTFTPLSEASRPALAAFLAWQFKSYMQEGMTRLKAVVESAP